jgi:hypothetical protein
MVLSDLPQGYWRLGETSGTTAADQTGATAGTYQNGTILGLNGALANDNNRSAGFDGTNDQVSMGDPASGRLDVGTADFSFEAWVLGTSNRGVIASKRPTSSSAPYWRLTIQDDGDREGQLRAVVFDGVATVSAYGPSIRLDNFAWHHVAVAFDRDVGVTIWVDGVSRSTSGAFPRNLDNTGPFVVGRSPNESGGGIKPLQGMVDEVAFYRGLLSGARVAAHRNLGLGPYRTAILADGPRAYWRLGEPSGTVAFDELGAAWGSYQNGVTLSALGALTTDTNRAVSLDGVNDQVSMGDPSNGALDAGTGDFSFETWLKTTTNGEHVIASKRPSSAASPYWRITVSDDAGHVGHVRANAFDGVASIAAYGPSIRVDNGAWHHVVVVFDRDTGH